MPYIDQLARQEIRDGGSVRGVGELNYAITMLLHGYLHRDGRNPGYGAYNEVLGVLECAKLELYRRHVAPYEDGKIKENGDVP